MLVAAVALSMLIGPLVLVLMDKLLLKRFADMKDCQADGAAQAARAHEISEPQDAEIIIAGFGRYGQIVARVLLTQGVPATILDHSVEMLEVATPSATACSSAMPRAWTCCASQAPTRRGCWSSPWTPPSSR
jgi:glutathione-regulated potassium-efflux system ancillary protein KefC